MSIGGYFFTKVCYNLGVKKEKTMKNNINGYSYPELPTRKWVFRVIAPILLFLLANTLSVFFYIATSGVDVTTLSIENADISGMVLVFNLIVIAVLAPIYFRYCKKGYFPKSEFKPTVLDFFVMGVVLFTSASIIIGSTNALFFKIIGYDASANYTETMANMKSNSGLFLQLLSVGIVTPIAEELIFRGMMQNRLSSRLNKMLAAVLVAVIFGLIHLDIYQSLDAILGGFILCFLYMKTGSLSLCITGHIANNILGVIGGGLDISATVSNIIFAVTIVLFVFSGYYLFRRTKNN